MGEEKDYEGALGVAITTWRLAHRFGSVGILDRVTELADYGVFSKRQIAKIAELPLSKVAPLVDKTDRTGGRLNPESLEALRDLVARARRGEDFGASASEILRYGTSASLAARFAGLTPHQVRAAAWQHDRARRAEVVA